MIQTMKLDEFERFRSDEERQLTPQLGPEEAQRSAQAAYEERLNNLEEEIKEQLRADIARAREIQSRIRRRDDGGETDGTETTRVSFIVLSTIT